jgi:hypothetical protein
MRRCARCRLVLPEEAFPERKLGTGRRHGHCRACKAAYQKDWYERNKARHKANVARIRKERTARNRLIIEAAKDVPCADCAGRFPPYVMDFDHVRGEKRATIASWYASASETSLRAEIAKCDVVCANCHRIRTYSGSRLRYHRRGPRDVGGETRRQYVTSGSRVWCPRKDSNLQQTG